MSGIIDVHQFVFMSVDRVTWKLHVKVGVQKEDYSE